jgi:Surface antigen variable number repeat
VPYPAVLPFPPALPVPLTSRPIGGTPCVSISGVMPCSRASRLFLILLVVVAAACKEEGPIKVKKLTFMGVQSIDESRLKAALATKESSFLPWGRKRYFDRSRFEADVKRIQAFYADRGFPDARVSGFDVKLNDKQDRRSRSLRSTSMASTSSLKRTSPI